MLAEAVVAGQLPKFSQLQTELLLFFDDITPYWCNMAKARMDTKIRIYTIWVYKGNRQIKLLSSSSFKHIKPSKVKITPQIETCHR